MVVEGHRCEHGVVALGRHGLNLRHHTCGIGEKVFRLSQPAMREVGGVGRGGKCDRWRVGSVVGGGGGLRAEG